MNLLLGLLNVACGLIFIYISKLLVDIATGRREGDLWTMVGFLATMLVIRLAITGSRQWLMGRIRIGMTNHIRRHLFDEVLNAPWHGREDRKSGDVMSRVSEDLRVVVACIISDVPSVIISLVQLLAASCFLFLLQPRLLWVMICIMPLALLLSKLYYRTMHRLTRQMRAEEADIQSHMQESVLNRSLLLSLRCTDLMSERLSGLQNTLFDTFARLLRFSVRARLFVHGGFSVGYYTAFVWSVFGLMNGSVTYGMMTALLQLVAQVQNPILNLSELFPSIVKALTAGERLEELDVHDLTTLKPHHLTTSQEVLGIQLQQLSYRYPDGDREVLHAFSYQFAPGSSTAILGPTGSGKTTLVRLLLGLLQPTGGVVSLVMANGQTVQEPLSAHICYVPQGNSLLSGTIRYNLQLGKTDATEAEMHDALRRASALFVYDLPQGLDSLCGEKGSGLSEGQAQRIAIARALLQPGSILLMDEASSALDTQTERQILEELQSQPLGKTLIWVTHHLVVREYMEHCLVIDEQKGV